MPVMEGSASAGLLALLEPTLLTVVGGVAVAGAIKALEIRQDLSPVSLKEPDRLTDRTLSLSSSVLRLWWPEDEGSLARLSSKKSGYLFADLVFTIYDGVPIGVYEPEIGYIVNPPGDYVLSIDAKVIIALRCPNSNPNS